MQPEPNMDFETHAPWAAFGNRRVRVMCRDGDLLGTLRYWDATGIVLEGAAIKNGLALGLLYISMGQVRYIEEAQAPADQAEAA
ncbi:hypothetical protein HBA54_03235 [Pelagibius litoralis]|uniref:Uncharacterized protein n=1 Tax=Pelagibius litoralis TaxID=374515 RepID=A0A967EUR8_9PROT|nr:hypothetical protein [Pelagibius litoralis]NIA67596.1 hypothetical protein [Pelagibius litoralis]